MGNTEHIQMLMGGVTGWNAWRTANPTVVPDLSNANLKEQNLTGANLREANLRKANLTLANLAGADMTAADLSDADLSLAYVTEAYTVIIGPEARLSPSDSAVLRETVHGAILRMANLTDTKLHLANLEGSALSGARLYRSDLTRANLVLADLSEAYCWGSTLDKANLSYAVLRGAVLVKSSCRGTWFDDADLTNATFWVDIEGASLQGANLDRTDVSQILYDRRRLRCRGVHVDSCYGNAIFRRDAQDEDWLATFREKSKVNAVIYRAWSILSDCGRSFLRVALLGIVITLAFAMLFHVKESWFALPALESQRTWLSPLHSSVLIFTSFGFADFEPRSVWAQIATMAEVILGYITLGLLISIFANKVARRA